MKSRFLGILSLLVLALALTACDGSSDSSSSSSSSAKGAVAAAPMKLAKVYGLSTEGKNVLIGTTDNSGAFTANSNASKLQFPAVVWSAGGWNVNDDPTNPDKEFKGTLKGVMESADSAVYLTPANSLIAAFFEKSGNLTDAKQQVISLLKYEMGLKSADPLGDPLIDLNDSEIVAKSLMHFIGAGDENNGDAMELLSTKFARIVKHMNDGMTFTEVLKKEMPDSPFYHHDEALCDCVTAHADAIAKEAKDSLGKLGDSAILEKMAVPNDTSNYPITLEFDGLSSTEKRAGTPDTNVDIEFYAKVKKANGKFEASKTLYVSYLANGTLNGAEAMNVGEIYENVDASQKLIFSVTIPEDATFPFEASFTLETIEDNPAFPTFSRNYTVTFIGEDEFAVKEVAYSGDKLFTFNDSTVDGKIAEAAISTDAFTANVTLVNPIDESFADGNMDVRFIAPAGFAFNNPSENEDAIIIESFTKEGSVYTTKTATYDLAAKTEVKAGFKTFGIQVLDQDGNLIAQTSKEVAFIPAGTEKDLIEAMITNDSVIYANGDTGLVRKVTAGEFTEGKFEPTTLTLKGSFKTWEKMADPDAHVSDAPNFPDDCKVILLSESGATVFRDEASNPVNYLDITDELRPTDKYTFSANLAGKFIYHSNVNDKIKVIYFPDGDDYTKNIESPNVLELQFEDAE